MGYGPEGVKLRAAREVRRNGLVAGRKMVVADRNTLWQMLHSSYESPDLLRLSSKLFFICKVNITRAVTRTFDISNLIKPNLNKT